MLREEPIRISVIVPVYNQAAPLKQCLEALQACSARGLEIIVVDDASTDGSATVAADMGVRVLRLPENSGPAAARNHGAAHAQGDILFFVDADVVVAPGAVDHVLRVLATPTLAAVFGSYDARPHAQGLVSQYRNLLHHFVHQQGDPDASTFWAGCGAIRRHVLEEVGGFDQERFPRSSIEDIELGYRLRERGHRILLDKTLQGTHLKRWRMPSYVWTDITRRAIPWARLILESGTRPNDLNLKVSQRLSAALVALTCLCLALAAWHIELLAVATMAVLGVVALNRHLFAFFLRERGLVFAMACIPLHLMYYLYSTLSYGLVWVDWHLRGSTARSPRAIQRG